MTSCQDTAAWAGEQGLQALAQGDLARALWLAQYATAVQPHDLDLMLLLGTIQLQAADPAAIDTFRTLADTHGVREGWFGMAAAAHRLGAAGAAAHYLAHGLAQHAPMRTPGFRELCRQIGHGSNAAGWCGLTADGVLTLALTRPGGEPTLQIDRLRPTTLVLDATGSGRIDLGPRLAQACVLQVRLAGRHLLGSPINLAALTRLEGVVGLDADGLAGWAWYPGDPDLAPDLVITARDPAAAKLRVPALRGPSTIDRRRFRVPAEALNEVTDMVTVTAAGRELLGSPLALRPPAPGAAGAPAKSMGARGACAGRAPHRPVDVVIPVFGAASTTLTCIDTVRASVPEGTRIIVVDDASPQPNLVADLQRLAEQGHITLIRAPANRGFPASANAGIAAGGDHDVVLLNSDTRVANDWLVRLRDAAWSAADIGTVTPLTNDGSLVSYDAGLRADVEALDRLAQRANGNATIDLPTAVGFCMYVRRDCLDRVGRLREDVFAQGYGEENDFCRRAARAGWRHVAASGVFVAHEGGQSFGAAGAFLRARNLAVLNRLHPGYDALIADFLARDPLLPARRRIDLARWAAREDARQAVIIITHDRGGGVRRRVQERCEELAAQGARPLVLLPVRRGERAFCAIETFCENETGDLTNLVFNLPDDAGLLHETLRVARPTAVELHHFIDHHPCVLDLAANLALPLDIVVHDYGWFCPRISLTDARHRYCGEPDVSACEICVAQLGHPLRDISVRALRARSAALFADARQVVVPSADCGQRLARHFPQLCPQIKPWQIDQPMPMTMPARSAGTVRICVAGAIGFHKGYECLLALGRDVAARALPMEYVLVGYSEDDLALMRTGVVKVTGPFAEGECARMLHSQKGACGFLPSQTPETWSYVLSEFWCAGLPVAVFDMGAPAERISATGRGILLPPDLPTERINDTLLNWARM